MAYKAVGTYNDSILNDSQNKKVAAAKKKYADAQVIGDTAGMAAAHAEAEAVRAEKGYSGGGDGSGYTKVTTPTSPLDYTPKYGLNDIKDSKSAKLSGLDLAKDYGITFDADAIEKIYNNASDAQYAVKQREYDLAENQYYQNVYANQQSALDTLRQQRNNQIASGMSAGLAAAADSAAVLGLQEQNTTGALELANERQKITDEIAKTYADNVLAAFKDSQTIKQAIAGLDVNKYGIDAGWDAAVAASIPQLEAVNSQVYGSKLGYLANLYGSDMNYKGQVESADITGKYNVEANDKLGRWGYLGTTSAATTSAEATKEAARIAAGAQTGSFNDIINKATTYAEAKANMLAQGQDPKVVDQLVDDDAAKRAGFNDFKDMISRIEKGNKIKNNDATTIARRLLEVQKQGIIKDLPKDGAGLIGTAAGLKLTAGMNILPPGFKNSPVGLTGYLNPGMTLPANIYDMFTYGM